MAILFRATPPIARKAFFFCDTPLLGVSSECDGPFFKERSGGVAAIVCDTTETHSATGVLLHLSRDRGGISVGSLSEEIVN